MDSTSIGTVSNTATGWNQAIPRTSGNYFVIGQEQDLDVGAEPNPLDSSTFKDRPFSGSEVYVGSLTEYQLVGLDK